MENFNQILDLSDSVKITSKEQDIEMFELNTGITLPPSYKEFSKSIGYGLLADLFLLYIPYYQEAQIIYDSLESRNQEIKETFAEYLTSDHPISMLKDSKNVDLLENAEPFGYSENGEFLFWDVRQKSPTGEFPVYLVNFPIGIYYGGASLHEFIHNITADAISVKKILTFNDEPLLNTFEPYHSIQ